MSTPRRSRRLSLASRLSQLLILMLVFFLAVSGVEAEETSGALLPSIRRIQERGELIIGIPPYQTPPFYSRSGTDQQLNGYDIEVARMIASRLGVRPVFDSRSTSFNDLVQRAGQGEVDLAIGKLGTTYPRMFDADPHVYMRFRQALLINRQALSRIGQESDPNLGRRLRQAPLRIGAIRKSAYDTYATDVFRLANIFTYQDWSATVNALKQGKVDAIYRDANEIRMLTLQDPRLSLRYVPVIIDDMLDAKSIFVGHASADLGPFLDFVISSEFGIPDDRQIMTRYSNLFRSRS